MDECGDRKSAEAQVQETQVQVRFISKLPENLRVVNTPFAIPSSLDRDGLSNVINTLLRLEKCIPFDFLLDGELIQTSLETYLISKQLSAETILCIEYFPAVLPPTARDPQVHDDWVSAVDGSLERYIFTGSYDCIVRVWRSNGGCERVLKGHQDAVTSIAIVSRPGSNEEDYALISASKDRTLRLWQNVIRSSESSTSRTLTPTKCFKGHTASVQGVASSPSGNQVASGSWDSSIRLWKVADEADADEESAKKRKLNGDSRDSEHGEVKGVAQSTLEGHSQCVSAVTYSEDEYLFSVSWDHSVRSWNVETGVNTQTLSCSKALLCLSVGGEASALLATGGADSVLRIWDPRMVGLAVPMLQLTSHTAWVTSCKWHPKSSYHLLSSSHDGTIKLWDVRAKIPLITVDAHEDKVLCADWWKDDCIVSGGADSKLNILQGVKPSVA